MRRLFQTVLAASTVAVALVANANHASANDFDTYRESMKGFSPVIQGWLDEVDVYAAAAQIKPEIVQDAELADLAARGRSLVGDLAGTAAPGTHADQHAALTAAIEAIATAADDAPTADGALFAGAIADDMSTARTALRSIFSYALRPSKGVIAIPVPPVSGN